MELAFHRHRTRFLDSPLFDAPEHADVQTGPNIGPGSVNKNRAVRIPQFTRAVLVAGSKELFPGIRYWLIISFPKKIIDRSAND